MAGKDPASPCKLSSDDTVPAILDDMVRFTVKNNSAVLWIVKGVTAVWIRIDEITDYYNVPNKLSWFLELSEEDGGTCFE